MTKEQKVIVHVELDPELLEKIDQEAAKDLRTRKAQVLYILREHFNKNKSMLEKNKSILDNFQFKDPWENVEVLGDNNKNKAMSIEEIDKAIGKAVIDNDKKSKKNA